MHPALQVVEVEHAIMSYITHACERYEQQRQPALSLLSEMWMVWLDPATVMSEVKLAPIMIIAICSTPGQRAR